MRAFAFFVFATLCVPLASHAQAAAGKPAFGPLERLVGTWAADSGGGGQPGVAARGGEVWTFDLDKRVLMRRDYSEYPATKARPAFRHEGLMMIGPATAGGFLAHSYDNEDHIIEYAVLASDSAIVFTSRPEKSAPQFRLTYRVTGDKCSVQFEIAAPDQPGQFKTYVAGALHRVR